MFFFVCSPFVLFFFSSWGSREVFLNDGVKLPVIIQLQRLYYYYYKNMAGSVMRNCVQHNDRYRFVSNNWNYVISISNGIHGVVGLFRPENLPDADPVKSLLVFPAFVIKYCYYVTRNNGIRSHAAGGLVLVSNYYYHMPYIIFDKIAEWPTMYNFICIILWQTFNLLYNLYTGCNHQTVNYDFIFR